MTTYQIRDFGNDRTYSSLAKLKAALTRDFLNRSVTITHNGAQRLTFLDVSGDGKIKLSNGKMFSFEEWAK